VDHTEDTLPEMKTSALLFVAIFSLNVYGCSVNVAGPDVSSTAQQPVSASPVIPTSPPSSGTVPPQTSPTPVSPLTVKIPVTWADLKLVGKMVFTSASVQQDNPALRIQVLDLATGQISTLFQTTGLSWIYYMSASSTTGQIIMSYSPPPGNTAPSQQTLYSLPLDGSKLPQLLLIPPSTNDLYLQAEWSPDGKYLYYVHSTATPQVAGQLYPIYEIFRMAYPGGQPDKVARYAFWPRISSDSSQLVYVSSNPEDGRNNLFIANADGSNARQVMLTGPQVPDIIDAPIFAPDGKTILFSAPSPTPAYQPNWVEKLMGIQVAEAHVVPSEWWSVPLSGGVPKQLTHIQSPVLFASVSPDRRLIASYSGNGLFIMKPDGSGLTTLIPDLGGLAGMVSWLP
jgi:Tol biopolymer transport system component